jgi:uncharacterized coiled-coil protein SlyX
VKFVSNQEINFLSSPVLVQQSIGSSWYFSLNTQHELACCFSPGSDRDWSATPEILAENILAFTTANDQNDHPHFLARDQEEQVIYGHWDGNNWAKDILLFDKKQDFYLVINRQGIAHLFAIEQDPQTKSTRLLHQQKYTWWEQPEIIDSAPAIYLSHGTAAFDQWGILHLVYRLFHKQYHLYYRYFDPLRSRWSNPVTLGTYTVNACHPSLLIDHQGNLHLVWTAFDEKSWQVIYRKKQWGGWPSGGWQPERQLATGLQKTANNLLPLLLLQEKLIICYWQQHGRIEGCYSRDQGMTWHQTESITPEKKYEHLRYAGTSRPMITSPRTHWKCGYGVPPATWLNPQDLLKTTLIQLPVKLSPPPKKSRPVPKSKPLQQVIPANIPQKESTVIFENREQFKHSSEIQPQLEQLLHQIDTLKTTHTLIAASLAKYEKQIAGLLETSRRQETRLKNLSQQFQQQENLVKNLEDQLAKSNSLVIPNEKLAVQLEQLHQQVQKLKQQNPTPSAISAASAPPKLNPDKQKRGMFKKWQRK